MDIIHQAIGVCQLAHTLQSRRMVFMSASYVSASSRRPSTCRSRKSRSLKVGEDLASSCFDAYKNTVHDVTDRLGDFWSSFASAKLAIS